uniref:Uncharacterized protein n=1 Tax=Rhizophora mucronata TaxID=61149 RepID=A0A2P2PCM8_RHIMU
MLFYVQWSGMSLKPRHSPAGSLIWPKQSLGPVTSTGKSLTSRPM